MTRYDDLLARAQRAVMGTYGAPPIALVRGAGCTVWDTEGRAYLDLIAGLAVCAVGHAHPDIVAAVTEQMTTLGHVSNLFLTEPAVALAERLLALSGRDGRVFFCNSGAEANEAALKLARRRGRALDPRRTDVVAAHGSFHGRTLGALSLTGQPAKQEPFAPLLPGVRFVPYGDAAALDATVDERTAAIFLEPIQGEGGVLPAPPGYLAQARAIADRNGALLVLDEVQTGIGRTGAWFAWQREGVVPDVVTIAKGLGGGLPIGACVGYGDSGMALVAGDHGSTFGGNPVACAAGLAVISVIERTDLLRRATVLGDRLAQRAAAVAGITDVRGAGLLRALVLPAPSAKEVEARARTAGFLVNAVVPDAVRIAPPLVLSDAELDSFLDALPGLCAPAEAAMSDG
jgi:acetylornithine aminotransferase